MSFRHWRQARGVSGATRRWGKMKIGDLRTRGSLRVVESMASGGPSRLAEFFAGFGRERERAKAPGLLTQGFERERCVHVQRQSRVVSVELPLFSIG